MPGLTRVCVQGDYNAMIIILSFSTDRSSSFWSRRGEKKPDAVDGWSLLSCGFIIFRETQPYCVVRCLVVSGQGTEKSCVVVVVVGPNEWMNLCSTNNLACVLLLLLLLLWERQGKGRKQKLYSTTIQPDDSLTLKLSLRLSDMERERGRIKEDLQHIGGAEEAREIDDGTGI